jgi:glycosyltransferase involved in cell wall biosynthesis
LIDAIAMMPDDVTAAVLGHGPLQEELRERAQRKNIGDRVHFLGFRDDGASFIAAADVFVLSSVWEGVPLAVQEAILLGTPVVATDVGGMSELITDGVSGRLVRSGDPDALAAAMEVAISDAATAARYVDAARGALAELVSTTTMLGRLREIYLGAGVAK